MKKCSICGRLIKNRIFKTRDSHPKLIGPIHEKMIIKEKQEIVCETCLKKMKFCK